MTPSNSSNGSTIINANHKLVHGWVHQCNGRGTLDIVQSCVITIFLCSWSVLCLNIPEEGRGRWSFLTNKFRWMLFALVFPEVITAIAAEQWESASQTMQDALQLGHTHWTMRHAFFANMGGFILDSPGFPPFPIDGLQLLYLVEHKHLSFPEVDEKTISDKNKADGFARAITIVQIGWFCIQCIGRAVQHLAISTFELTTLTFIFCTLCTFFFWRHKPLDVETPIILRTEVPIAAILIEGGDRAGKPYSRTPLDFVRPPRSRTSLLTLFWVGLETLLHFDMESTARPIRTFGNSKTTPQRGINASELIFGCIFTLSYFGIHLVGWNFLFPSQIEQKLWRGASLVLMGLLVYYLVCLGCAAIVPEIVGMVLFRQKASSIQDLARIAPKWTLFATYGPVLGLYAVARGYIILEGLFSLRALPAGAYLSVNWSNFIPHV